MKYLVTIFLLSHFCNLIAEGQVGISYLPEGRDTEVALQHIFEDAKQGIDIATYEMSDDSSTYTFLNQMIEARRRGCRVRIFVDHFGNKLPIEYLKHAASQGIEVKVYNTNYKQRPLHYILSRTHAKMVIADGKNVVIGGRNIGADYYGRAVDENRIDADSWTQSTAFGAKVQTYFEFLWNQSAVMRVDPEPSTSVKTKLTQYPGRNNYSLEEINSILPTRQIADSEIDFISDDTKENNHVNRLVRELDAANHTIFLVTPYPIFPDSIFNALVRAKKRGVNVILTTNSLQSNNVLAAQVGYELSVKGKLLANGIKIWELEGNLNILHAKITVIDRSAAYVGSFNWDNRSAKNFESGVIIRDRNFAKLVTDHARSMVHLSERKTSPLATACARLKSILMIPFLPFL